jgi:hypothetical protein
MSHTTDVPLCPPPTFPHFPAGDRSSRPGQRTVRHSHIEARAYGPGWGPRLTPGVVLEVLEADRARELAEIGAALLREPADEQDRACRTRTLLQLLDTDELRAVAARVRVPTDGGFLELYHRLAPLC